MLSVMIGGMALVGIILGFVCCYKCKKGDWILVKYPDRPGKYTVLCGENAKTYKQRLRDQEMQQQQQQQFPPAYRNNFDSYGIDQAQI